MNVYKEVVDRRLQSPIYNYVGELFTFEPTITKFLTLKGVGDQTKIFMKSVFRKTKHLKFTFLKRIQLEWFKNYLLKDNTFSNSIPKFIKIQFCVPPLTS